jgi:hypothetical protein
MKLTLKGLQQVNKVVNEIAGRCEGNIAESLALYGNVHFYIFNFHDTTESIITRGDGIPATETVKLSTIYLDHEYHVCLDIHVNENYYDEGDVK